MSRQTVLLIFIATLLGNPGELLTIYFSVLLHELAHLTMCIILKTPTSHITIYPYGMRLQLGKLTTPREQILISVSGPLVNLLLFALGRLLEKNGISHGGLTFFTGANFMLFVFNMLPCIPLDGSEILRSAISAKRGIIYSYSAIIRISRAMLMIIFFLGCLLTVYRSNISLLVVLAALFKSLSDKKHEQLLAVKEIISGGISSSKKPRIIYAVSGEKAAAYIKHISFSYTLIILRNSAPPISQQKLLEAVKNNSRIRIDYV